MIMPPALRRRPDSRRRWKAWRRLLSRGYALQSASERPNTNCNPSTPPEYGNGHKYSSRMSLARFDSGSSFSKSGLKIQEKQVTAGMSRWKYFWKKTLASRKDSAQSSGVMPPPPGIWSPGTKSQGANRGAKRFRSSSRVWLTRAKPRGSIGVPLTLAGLFSRRVTR